MALEVHMGDLYATGVEGVLHHILEHEHQGMTGSYEHLKRLRCQRGDTLELKKNLQIPRERETGFWT